MQMVEGNLFIPLSPPTSPMSLYSVDPADVKWQLQDTNLTANGDMALVHAAEMPGLPLDIHKRPLLHSHKTFPYTLNRPTHSTTPLDSSGNSPAPTERITISNLEEVDPIGVAPNPFANSAPASPVSRLTPPSTSGDKTDAPTKEELMDDEDDFDVQDDDDQSQQTKAPLSAQELRAQKRKMKRFR